jgi:hypothetical protein
MDRSNELRVFLVDQTQAAVEQGLWTFGRGYYTNHRIPPHSLYRLHAGWAELAADLLLEQPSAGLIGLRLVSRVHWIREVAAVLERRAVELPTTEVDLFSRQTWGAPLEQYPRRAPVTAFVDIHTLGEQIYMVSDLAEAHGLVVQRAICLVDRHPIRTTEFNGIPVASVVHLPLSLWRPGHDAPPAASDLSHYMRAFRPGGRGTYGGSLLS